MTIRQRKKHVLVKPNVIPILDAVFIFIFFLLLSSEFLNIKEINTTLPIIKNAATISKDLNPLNLTILITKKNIIIKTGLQLKIYKKISLKNKNVTGELSQAIIELKESNPDEKTANIIPTKNIKFKEIIKIIDIIKLPSKDIQIKGFKQIVFE